MTHTGTPNPTPRMTPANLGGCPSPLQSTQGALRAIPRFLSLKQFMWAVMLLLLAIYAARLYLVFEQGQGLRF